MNAEDMLIVCLKAFGDLIIARTSIGMCDMSPHIRIAIADHLIELDTALAPLTAPHIVAHGEGRVPSLFDLKRSGLRRAVASGLRLRAAMSKLDISDRTVRVFDQVGVRERFIIPRARIKPLPPSPNVYHAYAELLGHTVEAHRVSAPTDVRTIGIFPASRIARKNVPIELVRRVVDHIRAREFVPELFLLDGERPDLERALPSATIVPRKFAAMLAAVRRVDAVVSADSMPAHMAEHEARPVFVLSPVDNRYWLPRSSFEGEHWARFAEATASHDALDRFLTGLRAPVSMDD